VIRTWGNGEDVFTQVNNYTLMLDIKGLMVVAEVIQKRKLF